MADAGDAVFQTTFLPEATTKELELRLGPGAHTCDEVFGVTVELSPLARADVLDVLPPERDAPARDSNERYRRLGDLGSGGMGSVQLVEDTVLDRRVALKSMASGQSSALRRFRREARLTAQLEHPGIIPIYELGTSADGGPYYTMRRVRGRSLRAALSEAKSLDERLALLDPFVQLCRAVGYAHSRRVVHRDLKPENVMLGPFGETLVLDWGLAKVVGAEEGPEPEPDASGPAGSATDLTVAGSVLGTPHYMSPEQAEGQDTDVRSDVWSLGIVLYEILAGTKPFAGDSIALVLAQVKRGQIPDLRTFEPSAPEALVGIVSKALHRSPSERFGSALELADEVAAFRNHATRQQAVRVPAVRLEPSGDRERLGLVSFVFLVGLTLGAVAMLTTFGVIAWQGPDESTLLVEVPREVEYVEAAGWTFSRGPNDRASATHEFRHTQPSTVVKLRLTNGGVFACVRGDVSSPATLAVSETAERTWSVSLGGEPCMELMVEPPP